VEWWKLAVVAVCHLMTSNDWSGLVMVDLLVKVE
jgi:hypothetical protein